jgi:hypothetical protein
MGDEFMTKVDVASAIWGYGFGRMEAEREAEKARKKAHMGEVEPAVSLERFEVDGLRAMATVKNVDDVLASVFYVLFLEVLKQPKIVEKKGLIFKKTKVKIAEKINKAVEPEVFTILPGQVFTFTMDLIKPLEANQRYVLELHMGEREYSEYDEVVESGWAYMLEFNGGNVKVVNTMNLEQAGIFWGKLIALAKHSMFYKNIYVRPRMFYEHYPHEFY